MTTWSLLQISHLEALESVADRPDARRFMRTSYCVAPETWRRLDEDELRRRVLILLNAAYAKRNYTLIGSDDPTPMALLGFDFAWGDASEFGGRPWTKTFEAFRIGDDGESWHLVPWEDRETVFDERLAPR